MVLVDGIYCPYVGHTCTRFLDEEHDVCQRYAPEVLCEGRLAHRRFCIDVYEYPNLAGRGARGDGRLERRPPRLRRRGQAPLHDARSGSSPARARRCGPTPTASSATRRRATSTGRYTLPESRGVLRPVEGLRGGGAARQARPLGLAAALRQPLRRARHDRQRRRVGENEHGDADDKPYKSTLKGGYWGPVRARCRPITSTHNEWFSFYQVGFRCCQDAKDGGRGGAGAAVGVHPEKQRMAEPPGGADAVTTAPA